MNHLLMLSVCAGLCCSSAIGGIITIDDIMLDGFQPVPPTGSLATGIASIEINTSTRDIHVEGSFEGLEGDVLFGHLHGPADFGQSSPLVIFALQIDGDFMRSGTFSADVRVNQFQFNAIMDSRTYLNIHSVAHPSGEIRGQVVVPAPSTLAGIMGFGLIATRRRR